MTKNVNVCRLTISLMIFLFVTAGICKGEGWIPDIPSCKETLNKFAPPGVCIRPNGADLCQKSCRERIYPYGKCVIARTRHQLICKCSKCKDFSS